MDDPSHLPHAPAATDGADTDIFAPYFLQELCHGKTFIVSFESLSSLYPEDCPQVPGTHAVVDESIIADLLEARRQNVHEETPYEFFVAERYYSAWLAMFFCPGTERYGITAYGNNPAVRNRYLMCVPPKILYCITEAVECLLDVGAPVLTV